MPVNVQWGNTEKTVIVQQYQGDVTVDEYLYVINRTFHMLMSVSHTVHLIYDRTRVKTIPVQMSRIIQYAGKHTTSNLGMKVVVGANLTTTLNLQLCKVLAPALARNVQMADSLIEARAMLPLQDERAARV